MILLHNSKKYTVENLTYHKCSSTCKLRTRVLRIGLKRVVLFVDDTTEGKTNASCSVRRKSARLFEKRAASLLSCRTSRPAAFGQRRTARFRRKRKQICWLYKGTSCMGGSKVHPGIVDRSRGCKSACSSECKGRLILAKCPN